MADSNLYAHYLSLATIHGVSGFVGKVALGSTALMATRMKGTAPVRLACMVIAAQAFVFAGLAMGNTATNPIALAGAVLGVCALIVCANPEGSFAPLPKSGWRRGVAIALWVWALWYPVFAMPRSAGSVLAAIFNSPVGVIPHPTILAALLFAWGSWPNTPRLLGWGAVAAAAVVGVADVAMGGIWSSALLPVFAALVAKDMLGSAVRAGVLEDDTPPVERAREKARRAPKEEAPQGPQKVWKIK